MSAAAQIRKLALALPGVEEKSHFASPSFRFEGRIFIQINDKKNEAVFKLSPMHQETLFDTQPDVFKPEIWGNIRWARLMLDAIAGRELPELVREAYDQVATLKTKTPRRKR